MRKYVRFGAAALLAMSFVVLGSLAIYDYLYFWPNVKKAREIIARLDDDKDWPKGSVVELWRSASGQGRTYWAVRILHQEVNGSQRISQGQWTCRSLLWTFLARFHLSEREQLGLFLELTPVGNGEKGLIGLANQLFGKPVRELNVEEASILFAIARVPDYRDDPVKLKSLAEGIARKYKDES